MGCFDKNDGRRYQLGPPDRRALVRWQVGIAGERIPPSDVKTLSLRPLRRSRPRRCAARSVGSLRGSRDCASGTPTQGPRDRAPAMRRPHVATASPSSLACVASTFQGPAWGESVKYSDGTIEALALECRAGDARRRVHLVRKFGEVWRSRVRTMTSMRTRTQEMAITGLGHPARAGEVAVVDEVGALGLPIRIEAEDGLDCLFPVRALFIRVEQAQIGGEMPLVIRGQLGAVRRAIFEGGGIHIGRRFRVGFSV